MYIAFADSFVKISIHAPKPGATGEMRKSITYIVFQSTLPSRERPGKPYFPGRVKSISIHAPKPGATQVGR